MCNIQPAKKTRQQSTGETQYVTDDVTVFQSDLHIDRMLEDVHAMVQPLATFHQVHQLNLRPLPAGHAATKGCRQQ